MKNRLMLTALVLMALVLAACGTTATPVPNSQTLEAQANETVAVAEADDNGESVAQEPTATLQPPTDTPEPTSTPTEVPPTEAPTEAPAEEPQAQATQDPLVLLISRFGDPARGEQLFNTSFETNKGTYMCSTCHLVDSDAMLIGPGLAGLSERAAERIPDMPAEVYIYHSIVDPDEYIVEGYSGELMPDNYDEILADQDLYDISAYILSLN